MSEITDTPDFLSQISSHSHLDLLEEMIGKQAPITHILRLLSLYSLTNNGIKPKLYEFYRREIVQTYGFKHIKTLQNLEAAGLIRKTDTGVFGKSGYTAIRKNLNLIVDDVDEVTPNDISYVYSGYAPISIRLVQLALTGSVSTYTPRSTVTWKGSEEVCIRHVTIDIKMCAGG